GNQVGSRWSSACRAPGRWLSALSQERCRGVLGKLQGAYGMSTYYHLSAAAKRRMQKELDRIAERRNLLSAPITRGAIVSFSRHLLAVSFGAGEECWIYIPLGRETQLPEDTAFRTNAYAQVRHNGEMVGAHKFALAVAQGISLAELEGMDVHHNAP